MAETSRERGYEPRPRAPHRPIPVARSRPGRPRLFSGAACHRSTFGTVSGSAPSSSVAKGL